MRHGSFRTSLRHIASVIAVTFLFQQVAFAAPTVRPVALPLSQPPQVHFTIPSSVAVIDEAYRAPSGEKTIILMRDAHTNDSGQMNLAKALEIILARKDIRYVFTEAGHGDSFFFDHC